MYPPRRQYTVKKKQSDMYDEPIRQIIKIF